MSIIAFDHVAVPTAKPEEMLRFYRALGFSTPAPEKWRAERIPFFSIQFGENKISVHAPELWQDGAFTLRGKTAQPGCGDFCFVWSGALCELKERLHQAGAIIEGGPLERVGGRNAGRAKGMSVYTRDPDNNLLEFIVYESAA
jgi:catechol 2,3-dioxygenase-like lactoylglutathione lyase family enzyme